MTAEVHLRLRRDVDDDGLSALRQSLADCLAGDVTQVRVHVDPDLDLDADVLRALQAAAEVLRSRGGSLLLLGAGDQVRRRAALHGVSDLLPHVEADPATAPIRSEDAPRG
ncbi:MAG: hypothetical protein JWO60_206 [Frankiales bacterium]|nr:hypothetical protein [Frankiales bacterium]